MPRTLRILVAEPSLARGGALRLALDERAPNWDTTFLEEVEHPFPASAAAPADALLLACEGAWAAESVHLRSAHPASALVLVAHANRAKEVREALLSASPPDGSLAVPVAVVAAGAARSVSCPVPVSASLGM